MCWPATRTARNARCRIITIQSSPAEEEGSDKAATLTAGAEMADNGVNLYILAGHEAMQL